MEILEGPVKKVGGMKDPLDKFPYDRDPRSRPIATGISDGLYVYVQDAAGTIYVLHDGPHIHPRVLGDASPAKYAGDLFIRNGIIQDLTNLSGTFQFEDPSGLLAVADCLIKKGCELAPNAIRFFPGDGSRPVVLMRGERHE